MGFGKSIKKLFKGGGSTFEITPQIPPPVQEAINRVNTFSISSDLGVHMSVLQDGSIKLGKNIINTQVVKTNPVEDDGLNFIALTRQYNNKLLEVGQQLEDIIGKDPNAIPGLKETLDRTRTNINYLRQNGYSTAFRLIDKQLEHSASVNNPNALESKINLLQNNMRQSMEDELKISNMGNDLKQAMITNLGNVAGIYNKGDVADIEAYKTEQGTLYQKRAQDYDRQYKNEMLSLQAQDINTRNTLSQQANLLGFNSSTLNSKSMNDMNERIANQRNAFDKEMLDFEKKKNKQANSFGTFAKGLGQTMLSSVASGVGTGLVDIGKKTLGL